MSDPVVRQCDQEMAKRLKAFEGDLTKVRTGRASVAILDRVRVDYYGSPAPLSQVANLTTPDARTIAITPFEKTMVGEIEKAILKADLGFSPTNDGHVVRIPIPPLTEERRKEIAKGLRKMGEDAKVNLRSVRKDANDEIKKKEKAKELSEDEAKRVQAEVQKVTDKYVKLIDDRLAAKEKEVLTV